VTEVLVLAKTGLNQSAILLHFCIKPLFRRIAPVEGTRGSSRGNFFLEGRHVGTRLLVREKMSELTK
jgi:hypothetical protein